MEFHLVYRGDLKANGDISHKHEIRSAIHRQLINLWTHSPLSGHLDNITKKRDACADFCRTVNGWDGFTFIPLVNEKVRLMSQLDITLLRPEAPGKLITQSGDIDNRLKTLFDAMRMPKDAGEKPRNAMQPSDPFFFCLLEDDNLISRINVNSDWLLDGRNMSPNEVVLLIKVRTWLVQATKDYTDLGV